MASEQAHTGSPAELVFTCSPLSDPVLLQVSSVLGGVSAPGSPWAAELLGNTCRKRRRVGRRVWPRPPRPCRLPGHGPSDHHLRTSCTAIGSWSVWGPSRSFLLIKCLLALGLLRFHAADFLLCPLLKTQHPLAAA